MVIDPCCWKRWWTAAVFAEPATVLPTGCMSGKPQDAAAWTGSIRLTVKPSKTSTSILWYATSVSTYAVPSRGKQILFIKLGQYRHSVNQIESGLLVCRGW